jgi:putative salt-induced outer membrane protein YdiY
MMKLTISLILLCTILLTLTNIVFADQIILKNGDRFTGNIIKKDGETIVIQTENAGIITVKWFAVDKIVAENTMNLTLADGKTIRGKISADEDNLIVDTETEGKILIDKENISSVRSQEEQTKYDNEQNRIKNPKFGDRWTGNTDLGYAFTSGNSTTSTLTLSFRLARETAGNKVSLYANALQAKNKNSGTYVSIANARWYGGRYDVNLSKRTFAFASADFEQDQRKRLRIRSSFGNGIGHRTIKNDRTKLEFFGGAAYTFSYFTNRTSERGFEMLLGNELNQKINNRVSLTQRLVVYPLVTSTRFRTLFDASVVTSLNSFLGWHVTVGNRYNNKPTFGTKVNDFSFSTGIRARFGKR